MRLAASDRLPVKVKVGGNAMIFVDFNNIYMGPPLTMAYGTKNAIIKIDS